MYRIRSQFVPFAVVLALTSVVSASGCNALDFVPLATAEARLSEDFKTSNSPKIIIETFNGSIDVSRGTDGAVAVDVTKRATGVDQAAAEAALNNIQVSMIQKADSLTITAKQLERRPGNFGASVVISVPAAAELELHTDNGAIVSEDIEGQIEAVSSNGKLEIVGARGPLSLATSNGAIEVEGTPAKVDAHTSNGRIAFRGTLADGRQEFKTSNGAIVLVLPDDSQFRVDAHTSNSRIRCDFAVTGAEDRKRRRDLEGIVGDNPDPACVIELTTSNGAITLQKAGTDSVDKD